LTSIFHALIITSFLLVLCSCGYKAAPYYQKKAPKGDENIKFILKKKEFPKMEDNVSCE